MKQSILKCIWLSNIIFICLLFIGCGKKLDFNNPKAVAQMSIDSIMNEDYQLYLKILSQSSADYFREVFKHRNDPLRVHFDDCVSAKHATVKWLKFCRSVEYKVKSIEIMDKSEHPIYGNKAKGYGLIVTYEILNYTSESEYSRLQLPLNKNMVGIIHHKVIQESDGWKILTLPNPEHVMLDFNDLIEEAAKAAGY